MVSGNSRSRPFPRMEASDSLSRIMGMDFFIPFPFPNFGNAFFSFPSRSRIMGMGFFHSLPVPEIWEWIFFIPFPFPNFGNVFVVFPSRSRIVGMDFFHSLPVPEFRECFFSFPSRSRIMGMVFFHSLPVPKLWEWIFLIPFPFPNLLFHRRESKRELDYCKRYQASNFFSFLYISQNNYIEEVN